MEAKLKHDNDNIQVRDLLLGAKAIAEFLGVTPRHTYRLIYDDCIPNFKLGGTVAAR
jgi:predicted DNA-binding transcriptional regulator AlpA